MIYAESSHLLAWIHYLFAHTSRVTTAWRTPPSNIRTVRSSSPFSALHLLPRRSGKAVCNAPTYRPVPPLPRAVSGPVPPGLTLSWEVHPKHQAGAPRAACRCYHQLHSSSSSRARGIGELVAVYWVLTMVISKISNHSSGQY